jgi:phosphoribosylanthranilate isomerase
MMTRTQIKFCGMTRATDVSQAVSLGADLLGFVCVPGSKRYVSVEQLPELLAATGKQASVLLFQDAHAEFVRAVISAAPPTLLQFHGAETPEFCASFGLPFIKAVPMADQPDLLEFAEQFRAAYALLLDSHSLLDKQKTGGSGHAFDWQAAAHAIQQSQALPTAPRWFLAGGLTAERVGAGISMLRPFAVDVSSGIEASTGVKSVEKMRAFIESVRATDDTTHHRN